MQRLVIETDLLSLNTVIASAKSHWGVYSAEKRRRTEAVMLLALSQKLTPVKSCTVRMIFYAQHKRIDPDNLLINAKYVLDGLQGAEIITSDGWGTIEGLEFRFLLDRDRPRIEVELIEGPKI